MVLLIVSELNCLSRNKYSTAKRTEGRIRKQNNLAWKESQSGATFKIFTKLKIYIFLFYTKISELLKGT